LRSGFAKHEAPTHGARAWQRKNTPRHAPINPGDRSRSSINVRQPRLDGAVNDPASGAAAPSQRDTHNAWKHLEKEENPAGTAGHLDVAASLQS